jgi:hypothetical protein
MQLVGRAAQRVVTYDDHSAASDAVRAFQRAVSQDKVVAVIGSLLDFHSGNTRSRRPSTGSTRSASSSATPPVD